MIRRAIRAVPRPIAASGAALCACTAALCTTTGSAAGSSGGGAIGPSNLNRITAQPADLTVSATSNGMTIATGESALLRTTAVVNGNLPAGDAGQTVAIQVMGARTSWSWQPATQTVVSADGSYSASWTPRLAGQFAVRAVVEQSGATAATNLPTVTVTVYRPAVATLYGPGFYGRYTACGRVLRRRTIGIANRTLPCGTSVAVYYDGRMMVMPVIDRGPYANGASWDLTLAAAKALGMETTVKIGAVPLPRAG